MSWRSTGSGRPSARSARSRSSSSGSCRASSSPRMAGGRGSPSSSISRPGLPTVSADPTYVEQVVRNLLSNAAKYGGLDSTVTVRAERGDGEVIVRVLDNGPGFPLEERDRLFELFYRSAKTATTAGGAGIGLFVCARLVAAMGGRIWADRRDPTVVPSSGSPCPSSASSRPSGRPRLRASRASARPRAGRHAEHDHGPDDQPEVVRCPRRSRASGSSCP